MCRTSIFLNDMTMISYFNITINLVEFLKSSLAFLFITSSLLKFFHHITTIFTFFSHIANEILNTIFITIITRNMFLIFVSIRLIWILCFPLSSDTRILAKSAYIMNGDFIFLSKFFNLTYSPFIGILIVCLPLILKQFLI